MKTIAVIQPYFFPYAGYYRLFAASDVVVMFDCVQFPRRGWVHRNRFELANGETDWLSLPLAKPAYDARIAALRFPPDATQRLDAAVRRFPALDGARKSGHAIMKRMFDFSNENVTDYLCDQIRDVTQTLGIERPMLRSSTLDIDPELRAQDRVLAIVTALGGTRYVNPSGGRELYDRESFARAGVDLQFLTPYGGSMESMLARLLAQPPDDISGEIGRETTLAP